MKKLFYLLFILSSHLSFSQAEMPVKNVIANLTTINTADGSWDLKVVYVKGRSSHFDGGGGIFSFRPNNTSAYDNSMVVNSINSIGRWIREYDYIDVKYFGAKGNNSNNDTEAIQKAIDFAAENNFTQIKIPKGTYIVDSLIIKNGVRIKGEYKGTIIKSSNSSNTNLIEIDNGSLVNVAIEDLIFDGNNQNKTCFFIEAKGNIGGLFKSKFSNIEIDNFNGHGIYLKGGEYTSNPHPSLPNQFLLFEKIKIKRKQIQGINALRIEGQTGQVKFLNCILDGVNFNNGTPESWAVFISGPSNKSGRPAIIKFDTCSIQNSVGGIFMEYSENISIDNCWFENLDTAINVRNNCFGINITGNRFANASDYGDDNTLDGDSSDNIDSNTSGYILYVQNNSKVIFTGNLTAGYFSSTTVQDSNSYLYKLNNYYIATDVMD